MKRTDNRTISAKDSATSARTTVKRYKYYRIIDRRSVWINYLVKCDATDETAKIIERLDKLSTTSYHLDIQRAKYSKRTDYVIKLGRLYLVDNYNNTLIPQSIEEFISLHI